MCAMYQLARSGGMTRCGRSPSPRETRIVRSQVLPLLIALLPAAAPAAPDRREPVAIVISSNRGADPFALKIAAAVHQALKREGVADPLDAVTAEKRLKRLGSSNPRSCQGGP